MLLQYRYFYIIPKSKILNFKYKYKKNIKIDNIKIILLDSKKSATITCNIFYLKLIIFRYC